MTFTEIAAHILGDKPGLLYSFQMLIRHGLRFVNIPTLLPSCTEAFLH